MNAKELRPSSLQETPNDWCVMYNVQIDRKLWSWTNNSLVLNL